jgi:hypothetical protein
MTRIYVIFAVTGWIWTGIVGLILVIKFWSARSAHETEPTNGETH